jgi:hypothetical protein
VGSRGVPGMWRSLPWRIITLITGVSSTSRSEASWDRADVQLRAASGIQSRKGAWVRVREIAACPVTDRSRTELSSLFVPSIVKRFRGLEDSQQLHHSANQQSLIIDLHPGAGLGGEDDVVARLDGHLHPG